MNYNELSIEDLHKLMLNGQVTSEKLISEALKKAHKTNEEINAFVTIIDDAKGLVVTDDVLSGIPYACKDNLSTKGILSTASSNTLKDYVPIYDATCIKKLKEHNSIMIGKTVMDELGMGGTGTTGATGIVHNPWDKTRMTAGSSAGSAAAVALGIVPFALGSDTGDSIRKPAAYCGIVGYKPTYGLVSRYGLFPFASSLDHVGVLTRNVYDAGLIINAIKGQDINDMTSINSDNLDLIQNINKPIKGKKLFYLKDLVDLNHYKNISPEFKEILTNFASTIKKCEELGFEVTGIEFNADLLKSLYPTYICLSCAEATSNDSNLTGISFGPRGQGSNFIEMMKDHRTKGFSPLIKRRFIIGSYVLQRENQEKYFLNAKRVRRLITEQMNVLFKSYDAMIMPASSDIAKKLDQVSEVITDDIKEIDNLMVIGNFGGYPSITIPNGFVSNMPIGINITANVLEDENLLNIASTIENSMPYKNQTVRGDLK